MIAIRRSNLYRWLIGLLVLSLCFNVLRVLLLPVVAVALVGVIASDGVSRSELYRWLRTGRGWIGLLLPGTVGAARVALSAMADARERSRAIAEAAEQGEPWEPVITNGFGPLADGLRTGGAVLTLVALFLGAVTVARDREIGYAALASLASSRLMTLCAKAYALAVLVLLSSAILFGLATGTASLWFDLGPVVEEGFEMATADELWRDTFAGFLAALPALYASACFGLFVSSWSRGTGAAVSAAVLPVVLFNLFEGLWPRIAAWTFVPYTPLLSEDSPLGKLTKIARAFSDVFWEDGELKLAVLVPAWSIGALWVLTWAGLRSRSPMPS